MFQPPKAANPSSQQTKGRDRIARKLVLASRLVTIPAA